ncbi:MAG: transcriptional repressor NrdR [Chloroflexi bacterium]|nr:transcriptional repressor NrdR [Chloroflexota bacterium]
MKCPFCGNEKSRVIDTREMTHGIRRRRECQSCKQRYTTHERVAPINLMIIKTDGRREEFDRDKLFIGIASACAKRPVPTETVENMVNTIESELYSLGRSEVSSQFVGERVMARLLKLDDVAYVRFASVYRRFADIDTLAEEIRQLKEQKERQKVLEHQLRLAI